MNRDLDPSGWFGRMIDSCPAECGDVEDDVELDAYTSRVLMWAEAIDPLGFEAWSRHALKTAVDRRVADVLTEMEAKGEVTRHVGDDGTVSYSKVGA